MHIEEHNHCFMHYFGVKTRFGTLFFPLVMNSGYRARFRNPLPEEPDYEEPVQQLCGLVGEVLETAAKLGKVRGRVRNTTTERGRNRVAIGVEENNHWHYIY